MKLADINLLDPDQFVKGVPHEVFQLLRAEAPVYKHPEPGGPGFWVLTRYHDIIAASQDWASFSSAKGVVGLEQALTEGGDITVSRLSVASGLMSDLGTR